MDQRDYRSNDPDNRDPRNRELRNREQSEREPRGWNLQNRRSAEDEQWEREQWEREQRRKARLQREMREKKRRRQKTVFVVEIVVLVILSIVLIGAVWVTKKLSLINREEVNKDSLYVAGDTTQSASGDATIPQPTQEPDSGLSGVDVIALVGLDTRGGDMDGENSDTMILCALDHNQKTIRLLSVYRDTFLNVGKDYYGESDYYTKCNAAYNLGGPTQFLSMVNMNFDLNVTEYVSVDFAALQTVIDALGGLDIDLTRQEIGHLNAYNQVMSEEQGIPYEPVIDPNDTDPTFDGYETRTFHLNGIQSVAYARIRYTSGYDMRRSARQRLVISKIFAKLKQADLGTVDSVLNLVLPKVTTNLENTKIFSLIKPLLSYNMPEEGMKGFPFAYLMDEGGTATGEDCIVPVTLQYNVQMMHEFLYPGVQYYPSDTVQNISAEIAYRSKMGDEYIQQALMSDDGTIPVWDASLGGLSNSDKVIQNMNSSGVPETPSSSE